MTARARRGLAVAVAVAVTAVGTAVLGLVTASPAQAAAYRFWSYWGVSPGGSSWTFMQVGPGGRRPEDGAVEGWRFAVSLGARQAVRPSLDAAAAFAKACGGTPAPAPGQKRVAVVVDFGTATDEPPGEDRPSAAVHYECVVVAARTTGHQVLEEAGFTLRLNGAMVCGISGYPRTGCGEAVATPPTTAPTRSRAARPRRAGQGTKKAPGAPRTAAARPTGTASVPGTAAPDDTAGTAGTAERRRRGRSATATAATSSTDAVAADDAAAEESPAAVRGAPEPAGDDGPGDVAAVVLGLSAVGALVGSGVLQARRRRRS